MRVLYLSQVIPLPLNAGPKVRIFHVLEYLAQAGHDITLVAFRREEDRPEEIESLYRYCSKIHTVLMRRSRISDIWHLGNSLISNRPFLISRDQVPAMNRIIQEVVERDKFDVIHADQLWMAQYALSAKQFCVKAASSAKMILDRHNAVYLVPRRMAKGMTNPVSKAILKRESQLMAAYEIDTIKEFDHVVWVTEEDLEAIQHINRQRIIGKNSIIPICVDPSAKTAVERITSRQRITFLGGLHWPPNAEGMKWFVEEVWPAVRERLPEVRLTIIGKDPPKSLWVQSSNGKDIEVTGYVDNIHPYLEETAVFIVPLMSGGGMRVKILDAWAWGLPVVSTSIGAEGLQYTDGENLLIADDKESFGNAVVTLYEDPLLTSRLATRGRETVMSSYNWRTIYKAWDQVYAD